MTTDLATLNGIEALEKVVAEGDLEKLSPAQRMEYYRNVCESLGLNPYTQPFQYIRLQGKLTFYARKDATEQLRKIQGVSITRLDETYSDKNVYTVTAYAVDKHNRSDVAKGAVFIGGLNGADLANAIMKAETKAKRRVTLSICGLGFLDETETETIPEARRVAVNTETGEIMNDAPLPLPAPRQRTPYSKMSEADKRVYMLNRIGELVSDARELRIEYTVPETETMTVPELETYGKKLATTVETAKNAA